MSRQRDLLFNIVMTAIGVACIGGGILLKVPPTRALRRHPLDAWADLGNGLGGAILGWALIVAGALILVALILSAFVSVPQQLPRGRVDAAAPPLPEARAHFTPPDERNAK